MQHPNYEEEEKTYLEMTAKENYEDLEQVRERLLEFLRDRFGIPVQPREWFLVPLEVIEEVIEKIQAGTLDQFRYDPETASLTRS